MIELLGKPIVFDSCFGKMEMFAVDNVSWSGGYAAVEKKISFESPFSSVAWRCDNSKDDAIVAHSA